MKLSDIIYKEEYESIENIGNVDIRNISTSVSDTQKDSLFVIIKSIKFDVSRIIKDVINSSPAAIICDKNIEMPTTSIPLLRVENTRVILPFLFSRFYQIDYSRMKFAAITGTNGKTTTATMLTHILKYAGKRVGFIGTGKIEIDGVRITDSKYSMTTPDPHLLYAAIKEMENAGCEFVIMEVSSHALYFDKVLPIPYEIAIFTNLSSEHMDFHNSMEDYYTTKLKLFKQSKFGIFNADDRYSSQAMKDCECDSLSIGIVHDADIMARDVVLSGLDGSQYIYRETGRLFKVILKLGGAFNIYNSMMALCAAIKLNVKPCVAKTAVASIDFIDGRLEIIEGDVTVIIDYAHTEEAFKNILKTIKISKKREQNLIVVFGCGGERDKTKRPKMAKIAEEYSDTVIVTNDNPRGESENEIIEDVLSGFSDDTKRTVITSRKSAISHAILSANKGDVIAIIGKGHERYNIDKNGICNFDERTIIKEALNKRKENTHHENCSKHKININ